MTWPWLRCRNLNKETASLFIAAQNDAIRNKYVKVKSKIRRKITSVG